MNRKKYLLKLRENLVKHSNFYIFKYASFYENKGKINNEGNDNILNDGIGIYIKSGSEYIIASDFAYEENGDLYHMLTSDKIEVIKLGENIIEANKIYAATNSIHKINSNTVEDSMSIFTDKHEFKNYVKRFQNK